jgi:hypothetical protein
VVSATGTAEERESVTVMALTEIATFVGNLIARHECPAASNKTFEKLASATGKVLSVVAHFGAADVDAHRL